MTFLNCNLQINYFGVSILDDNFDVFIVLFFVEFLILVLHVSKCVCTKIVDDRC